MSDRKPGVTFALCFLAALAEGYDLQCAGLTAPKFAPVFHLDPAHLSWVFTANTIGLFLGAIAGGRIADGIGRRWLLTGSMAVFGLFSIASAMAPDSPALILMRFLTGLGLGGALPNIIALTAEASDPRTAATRVTMLSAAMPFGGGAAGGLLVAFPAIDWRVIFWVGGVAPLLTAAVMVFALPESPVFAVRRDPEKVNILKALSEDSRALATVLLWVSFFCTLLVLYLLLNWLPSLLVGKGFAKTEAAMVAMIFTLGGGLGGLCLGPLARRSVRRWLFCLTWLGMAGGMVWLSLVGHDVMMASLAGLILGFFVIGGQFLLYGLSSELYPDRMRGTGVGFAVGVGRLGSVAGPLLAGGLLVAGKSSATVMQAVVPLILLALAAVLPLVWRDCRALH